MTSYNFTGVICQTISWLGAINSFVYFYLPTRFKNLKWLLSPNRKSIHFKSLISLIYLVNYELSVTLWHRTLFKNILVFKDLCAQSFVIGEPQYKVWKTSCY